eukprot:430321_1
MTNSTTKWIIWTISVAIIWLLILPVSYYWIRKFASYGQNIVMQKRHKTIAILIAIFALISMCIERPLFLLEITIRDDRITWKDIKDTKTDVSTSLIMLHFIHQFFNLIINSLSWLLMLRYWLIHFNVKWIKHTMHSKWIIHLNHDRVNDNWYLKNKNKYGNLSYTLKRLLIFLCLLFTLRILVSIIFQEKGLIFAIFMDVISNIFPMFAIIILYIKLLYYKFNDRFYIMKEIKYITLNFFIGLFVFMIASSVSIYLGATAYTRATLVFLSVVIATAFNIVIQIWWVVHVIENDKSIELQTNSVRSGSETPSPVNQMDTHYEALNSILSTQQSFDEFVLHLNEEWSIEIILALIEITQMQSIIKQYSSDNGTENMDENEMKYEMIQQCFLNNEYIVDSYVVYHKNIKELMQEFGIQYYIVGDNDKLNDVETDEIVQFKLRLYILYKKYVTDAAKLQLNIPYKQKLQLDRLMGNLNYFVNTIN